MAHEFRKNERFDLPDGENLLCFGIADFGSLCGAFAPQVLIFTLRPARWRAWPRRCFALR